MSRSLESFSVLQVLTRDLVVKNNAKQACVGLSAGWQPHPSANLSLFVFRIIDFILFFNWEITALQNFVVFCQTSTCINHRYPWEAAHALVFHDIPGTCLLSSTQPTLLTPLLPFPHLGPQTLPGALSLSDKVNSHKGSGQAAKKQRLQPEVTAPSFSADRPVTNQKACPLRSSCLLCALSSLPRLTCATLCSTWSSAKERPIFSETFGIF